MRRGVVACVGLLGLLWAGGGNGDGGGSQPRYQPMHAGPGLRPGLQLDRLLSRHQRRRRLGTLPVGRRQQVRHFRRPDRRHHRLQLAIQPVRDRRRGRHRLVGHPRNHDRPVPARLRDPQPLARRPCAAASATPSTGSCRTSPPASRSATSRPTERPGFPGGSVTSAGWTAGGGLEVGIVSNVSMQGRISLCRSRRLQLRLQLRPGGKRQRVVLRQRLSRRPQRPVLIGRRRAHDKAPDPVRGFSFAGRASRRRRLGCRRRPAPARRNRRATPPAADDPSASSRRSGSRDSRARRRARSARHRAARRARGRRGLERRQARAQPCRPGARPISARAARPAASGPRRPAGSTHP